MRTISVLPLYQFFNRKGRAHLVISSFLRGRLNTFFYNSTPNGEITKVFGTQKTRQATFPCDRRLRYQTLINLLRHSSVVGLGGAGERVVGGGGGVVKEICSGL